MPIDYSVSAVHERNGIMYYDGFTMMKPIPRGEMKKSAPIHRKSPWDAARARQALREESRRNGAFTPPVKPRVNTRAKQRNRG